MAQEGQEAPETWNRREVKEPLGVTTVHTRTKCAGHPQSNGVQYKLQRNCCSGRASSDLKTQIPRQMQQMCNSILKSTECVPILQKKVSFLSIPAPEAVSLGILGKFWVVFLYLRCASYKLITKKGGTKSKSDKVKFNG